MRRIVSALRRRSEVNLLARDAFWVSTWQAAVMAADLIQMSLVARALGLSTYGRLALIIASVTLISQFFDFRVGTAATTFAAPKVESGDVRGAAGIFQLTYAVDVLTGFVGFAAVAIVAVVGGGHVAGDRGTALVLLYGVTLLLSTADDSSTALLRLFSRFRLLAMYRLVLEAVRIVLIAVAVFAFHSLLAVVLALVVYDGLSAVANAVAACAVYLRDTGATLLRPHFRAVTDDRRSMLAMVFHTNVVSYAKIAMTQLPTLVVGAFSNAATVGVFKVGMAAALIPSKLSDPAYGAVLPRLSRLWAAGRFDELRRLLRHSTLIAAPAMAAAVIVVAALRAPIVHVLAGTAHSRDAQVVLLIAIAGAAVDGVLFWNDSLLYAARKSRLAALNALVTAVFQVVLLLLLVPPFHAYGAALAFLISRLFGNTRLTWLGMRALRAAEAGRGRSSSGVLPSASRASSV